MDEQDWLSACLPVEAILLIWPVRFAWQNVGRVLVSVAIGLRVRVGVTLENISTRRS